MFKKFVVSNKALLQRLLPRINKTSKYSNAVEEQQIDVNGQTINYVKHGTGSHNIFCLPGALGTIWSDFGPQIENLDVNKFTIIAWDPPGYGKSYPPKRTFSKDFYQRDANVAIQFIKEIGLNKISLLGWSDGGITAMIFAAKYPESVHKLVIWGANSFVFPEEILIYEKMRDLSKWSDKMKAPLIKLYGEKGLEDMWKGWCDSLKDIFNEGGNICKHQLASINCPTLILHGNKDPMVASEHPNHLLTHIKGSRLHQFPDGKHNIHLRYATQFNSIVSQFLEEGGQSSNI